jgi:predicted site-specific integrase-resolvase
VGFDDATYNPSEDGNQEGWVMRELLSTGRAAVMLGVSRERVLQYIAAGRLRVAARDCFGRRLLQRRAIEGFLRERERRRAARSAQQDQD